MMFPGTNFVAAGPTTRTPIEAAVELNQKYTDLILVAGSDRESMFNLLQDYNHKNYEYNSIEFVSAGERDPDSPGVAGISGTKMREAAVANDFATFQKGLPDSISAEGAQQLMSAVAAGLQKPARAKKGVAESLSPGEYHVWTVHFDDGGKGNIRVPSDEVSGDSIKRFYNKQGKNVVHIDYDWGVYSNDSPWTPKKLMHEPGGIEVDPLEGVAEATPKKLKTGPAAHFTPKDKHVKVGQFVGGMEESKSVNCIPLSEHVENIMGALINKIIVNEAIQNNRK
jgi:hypothetical protein